MNLPAVRGAVMTLLDEAMADAALRSVDFPCEITTVDIHIVFLSAATGRLRASANVRGGGRSVCFCEAEAVDDAGAVVARAMGTLRRRAAAQGPVGGPAPIAAR